jgi:putative transcriptional regulator
VKNRIKEFRKKKKLRQEDLAEELSVTRQTIIAVENDKYNPSLELAMKMAKFLETTVEELFELEEENEKRA